MPFIKRKVEPHFIRRHEPLGTNEEKIFEEHEEVVHHTLVNVLKQLSSLTLNAKSIFEEIESESRTLANRYTSAKTKLERIGKTVKKLNAKEVRIPVSALDIEQKRPVYLHYHAPDFEEEDLFTVDSRNPSLIHLHKNAKSDWKNILHGSNEYSKANRPKSLDPAFLIDDLDVQKNYSQKYQRKINSSKSTANIIASPELTDLFSPRGVLPTPDEKVKQDCSRKIGKIVSVDTSASQFDRKVNYRKSQRLSCTSAGIVKRRKSHQKLRERHKTLTALPGSVSQELEETSVCSSATNQSSVADHVTSNLPAQNSASSLRTTNMKFPLFFRRNAKHRSTIATSSEVIKDKQHSITKLSNDIIESEKCHKNLREENIIAEQIPCNNENTASLESNKNSKDMVDRTSSGFWSGTESARHSTTSENTTSNNNNNCKVTKSIECCNKEQFISELRHSKNFETPLRIHEIRIPSLSASTTSLNSRLSTFDTTSEISSVFQETPNATLTHNSSRISKTPNRFDSTPSPYMPSSRVFAKTPTGAYNYMHGDYDPSKENDTFFPKNCGFESPIDPIVMDGRCNDGFSSLYRARPGQEEHEHLTSASNYYGTSTFGSTVENKTEVNKEKEQVDFERKRKELQLKHQLQQEQLMIQQKHEELSLLKESPTRPTIPLPNESPTRPTIPLPKESPTRPTIANTVLQEQINEVKIEKPLILPKVTVSEEDHESSVTSDSSETFEPNSFKTPWKPKSSVKSLKPDRPIPPARWASFNRSPLRDAKNVMSMLESPPKKTLSEDKNNEEALKIPQSIMSSPIKSLPIITKSSIVVDDKKSFQKETAMVKPRIVAKISPLQVKNKTDQNSIIKKLDFSSQNLQEKKKIPPPTPPKPPKSVAMFINSFTDTSQERQSPVLAENVLTDLDESIENLDKKPSFGYIKSESTIPTSPEKPKLMPKPNLKPKPCLSRKSSKEVDEVYSKTANARAAFFGLSPNQTEQNSEDKIIKQITQRTKAMDKSYTPNALDLNTKITNEIADINSLTTNKSQSHNTCYDKIDQKEIMVKGEKTISESVVSDQALTTEEKTKNNLDNDRKLQLKDLADESNATKSTNEQSLNDESHRKNVGSRQKTSRYLNITNNGLKSPSSKSPSSTLERKSKRGGSNRRKNSTTSRNDFKALLLQSTSRGGTGSMSAAEKLKLTSPKNRSLSDENLLGIPEHGITMEDGKTSFKAGSGQGRVGRGLVRGSEGRYTVATSPLNFGFSRERPPLSQSARYASLRSKTPTRLMNAISEDSAEYESSPERKKLLKLSVRSETDV